MLVLSAIAGLVLLGIAFDVFNFEGALDGILPDSFDDFPLMTIRTPPKVSLTPSQAATQMT